MRPTLSFQQHWYGEICGRRYWFWNSSFYIINVHCFCDNGSFQLSLGLMGFMVNIYFNEGDALWVTGPS